MSLGFMVGGLERDNDLYAVIKLEKFDVMHSSHPNKSAWAAHTLPLSSARSLVSKT